jgi:hypothetical protein
MPKFSAFAGLLFVGPSFYYFSFGSSSHLIEEITFGLFNFGDTSNKTLDKKCWQV